MAARVSVEKGGHTLSYLETVLKNWDKPKPEKPHHLTNYRGRSPADKNMPRTWPGQQDNPGVLRSAATGKIIGYGS